jgi:hypothetical protein
MPNPDLEGARRKVDRAREYVAEIEAEHRRYFKRHPKPLRIGFDYDPHTQGLWVVVDEIAEPSPILPLIVGDLVHNLRSAVDHLAWQIVQHGNNSTLTPSKANQVQFPICDTLDQFNSEFKRGRLLGMGQVEETIIRRHQPYRRGTDARLHPLAQLRDLSNEDKHRNILIVYWAPQDLAMEPNRPLPPGCRVLALSPGPDLGKPFKVKAKLGFLEVSDLVKCRGVEMQTKGILSESFPDGQWVYASAEHMVNAVSELIAEIDAVL